VHVDYIISYNKKQLRNYSNSLHILRVTMNDVQIIKFDDWFPY